MSAAINEIKRDRTYWRGMYATAFLIGAVVPIAAICVVGKLEENVFWRVRSGFASSMILLSVAWSAITILGIAGAVAASWLVLFAATRLRIEQGAGFLRSMFLLAFALGAILPLVCVTAAVLTQYHAPFQDSDAASWIVVLVWFSMAAISIAGLVSAAWLVKTAGSKLRSALHLGAVTDMYEPHYASASAPTPQQHASG